MSTPHIPKTYRLSSLPMMDAPSIILYVQNAFKFAKSLKERRRLLAIVTAWPINGAVAMVLIGGHVPFTVEEAENGTRTVVFTA
jgi:hypothetical protein